MKKIISLLVGMILGITSVLFVLIGISLIFWIRLPKISGSIENCSVTYDNCGSNPDYKSLLASKSLSPEVVEKIISSGENANFNPLMFVETIGVEQIQNAQSSSLNQMLRKFSLIISSPSIENHDNAIVINNLLFSRIIIGWNHYREISYKIPAKNVSMATINLEIAKSALKIQ